MLLMSCCQIQQKAWLILPVVIRLSHWLSCSKKEFEVRFLPGPPNSPEPRRVQPTKKWPRKKKNGKLGKTTTTDHGGRGRRRPGSHGGGWSRRAELAARTGGLRAALARGRAADPGGPALLLSPGPAASQQGLRLQPAPHPRGAQRLHPAAGEARPHGLRFGAVSGPSFGGRPFAPSRKTEAPVSSN